VVTLDRRARWDLPATQDTPVTPGLREALEQLGLEVRKVSTEILGRQELRELSERLGPRVQQVCVHAEYTTWLCRMNHHYHHHHHHHHHHNELAMALRLLNWSSAAAPY